MPAARRATTGPVEASGYSSLEARGNARPRGMFAAAGGRSRERSVGRGTGLGLQGGSGVYLVILASWVLTPPPLGEVE